MDTTGTDAATTAEGAADTEAEATDPAEDTCSTTTTTVTVEVITMTERNHAAEISAMGSQMGLADLALKSIQAGHTTEQFQTEAIAALSKKSVPTADIGLTEKEVKSFSYVRAIAAALARAEGQNVSGFEVDISQEIERGIPANYKRNGGIFVPTQTRAAVSEALYNTSGKGSSTVFTQAGEFIDLLRAASVAVRLGARVLNGLTGPVSFPSQTGGATAYWMAENSGTNVTASNAALSAVSLSPKTLQGTTAFSRQLMAQSSLDVETFIRQDLATAHALAWDLAVLHGTGSDNQPTGIYAAANVNAKAMGGVPTFGKLIDMVTEVLKDNALAGSLAWATTPGMAGKLAQTVVAASTDTRMVWDGKLDAGTLCGYGAFASNQVSSTLAAGAEHGIIFGNWSDCLIGNFGALELVVDPYALKKQGMIEVTSFQLCDIALRHPESFCKATGATIS
jgi:HK97 family phage major capsid protein